jgi:antitoxin (DNA-binding transcriptional repressor) of toxin-antitoxin stability system
MKLTASRLRANIYRILDQVLETGEPVEIERRGRILRIVAVEPESWLDRIVPIPGFLKCDPDEIVHMDWSSEWKP